MKKQKYKISSLGASFVFYRLKNKLTQAELASLLGVNQSTVSRIERGVQFPNLENFIKIMKFKILK